MTRLAALAAMLGLLAAGCSGGRNTSPQQGSTTAPTSATGSTAHGIPGPEQLIDLRDIGQLRSLFNTRSGEPRLVLLASPT